MGSRDAQRIRELNDDMRALGPITTVSSMWVMTPGIQTLGAEGILAVALAIQGFGDFTPDNDPYGEHDFGSIEYEGNRIFWKIDYYDRTLAGGSPDPVDEAVTRRVLTIMLASEY